MTKKFETYGPFPLHYSTNAVTGEDIRTLRQTFEDECEGLSRAIGVYIICAVDQKDLIPLYVGKTERGFGKRFYQHREQDSLREKQNSLFLTIARERPTAELKVFLVARMTEAGSFMKPKKARPHGENEIPKRRKPLKTVDTLEFSLIGACLTKNPNLMNSSQKAFHESFRVPGYVGESEAQETPAAKAFRKMLRPRKQV